MMKKIFTILMLTSLLVMPAIGIADSPTNTAPTLDVWDSLNNIMNWVFSIIMVISVIYLMLGAVTYITAGGDADKVKEAWQKIMYALIGVGVALLANGLVNFVTTIVTPSSDTTTAVCSEQTTAFDCGGVTGCVWDDGECKDE
ncbi:MAG: pilin [Patescibacteria group bacterium]|nr:pilin [Patescibacteria group bacterium]